MYSHGEYDLAGFSVGAVRKSQMLPRNIRSGDRLLGLTSSGVHSNGYSLVRKCVEKSGLQWSDPAPFATAKTAPGEVSLGEALLTPTRLYVKLLLPLIKQGLIKGMAHITGGGLLDNLPRIFPNDSTTALIDLSASGWSLPPVFKWLQTIANLPQAELLRTFNNGIGIIVVVAPEQEEEVIKALRAAGEETVYRLGQLLDREQDKDYLAEVQGKVTTDGEQVKVIGTLL